LTSRPVCDLADVDGEDLPAGSLDPLDDFRLDAERPDEPVEERDDEHVDLVLLDEFDRAAEAGPMFEGGAARRVHLLDRFDEFEVVVGARGADTFSLFGRTDEAFALAVADTRDADDADGAGGSRGGGR
jgi:hypothetical protein